MKLSHADVDKLYSEQSVNTYRPEAVLVRLTDGLYIQAVCFNLPVPPALEECNMEYAAKLRDLANCCRRFEL